MAGKKLYELDPHSSIVDTDVVAISATDSGDAEKSTAAELKAYVKSGLSTADVSASTDKNYITDAQATVIGNTSGTNTGDETESSIKTKLGISTLSGSNTGDEDATSIKTKLGVSTLSGSNTGDQDLSGLASKTNVLELDNTDAFTPTADYHPATKKYVDDNSGGGTGNVTASGTLTDNAIILGGGTTVAKTSSKTIVTTLGADNTTVPTSGAVAAAISGSGGGDISGPASSVDSNVAMFNGTTGKLLKDSGLTISGSNTGDETESTIKTKLGITTLSGTNTGDQSASDFNHDDLSNITGTVGEYNHPTDAQMVVLGNTSNTNTGDEVVATGAEVDTGINNTKMVTPKAMEDSSYTKSALPLAGGTMTGNITLGENTGIALDPAGSADEKWSGITCAGTAGATLAVGNLIYLDATAGKWLLADADAASTSGDVPLGLCILASNDGQATNILLIGTMRSAAFPASIALGAPVYVSTTAGDIQAAKPSATDDVVRRVGRAITTEPNTMYFNPSNDYATIV